MLNNEEKLKIQLEESYRSEIRASHQAKKKIFDVEIVIKILQGLAIIIGIWATYNEFRKQNEQQKQQAIERHEQTAKEFRKYFYEKQFEYYEQAVEATAILSTEDIKSLDYEKAKKDFYRLFWGKLSIVEDSSVERSMIRFKNSLEDYEDDIEPKEKLQQASLDLAHKASHYTINVWVDSTERKKYNR